MNLYTPALLAKIKEDLVRDLGGDLKDLQKNIESAQARYYDILKMQLTVQKMYCYMVVDGRKKLNNVYGWKEKFLNV